MYMPSYLINSLFILLPQLLQVFHVGVYFLVNLTYEFVIRFQQIHFRHAAVEKFLSKGQCSDKRKIANNSIATSFKPVYKISQVVEKFGVVLQCKIIPAELTILQRHDNQFITFTRHNNLYLIFRSHVEQIESPHVGGNVGFHGIVTKHANAATFREFSTLVIEIVCKGLLHISYKVNST